MQRERALAVEYGAYARELLEVVVHTHDMYHGLMPGVHGQSLVLDALRGHIHLRKLLDAREHGVVSGRRLALDGHHLELRVEGGEERRHEVMEPVEHAQHYHHGHGGHGHAGHGDGRYHIYGIGALLGEQVAACYEERQRHCFSSESMCSM